LEEGSTTEVYSSFKKESHSPSRSIVLQPGRFFKSI
jgi:hypothetical protein